jgi:hypothetical protein
MVLAQLYKSAKGTAEKRAKKVIKKIGSMKGKEILASAGSGIEKLRNTDPEALKQSLKSSAENLRGSVEKRAKKELNKIADMKGKEIVSKVGDVVKTYGSKGAVMEQGKKLKRKLKGKLVNLNV